MHNDNLGSVARAAKAFLAQSSTLNVLITNAGYVLPKP
jgi:hypothetical protein